jgi:lipopolysaccharide transport system permease protein
LTIAELKNRYQSTSLGFFWSILNPFFFAMVLWFVFRNFFRQEENFAANLLIGIMAWRFFSIGTNSSLYSIVGKPSLVTKVFIPRQILVLSNALSILISSLLEFLVLLPILFIMIRHMPATVFLFPIVHLLYFWLVFGAGLLLSALFVYFRDLNQIWEVLINALFFCSPIIYPLSAVPPYLMPYYMLNPVTQYIVIYHQILVAGEMPSLKSLIFVIAVGVAIYLVGSFVFSKLQRRFAEEV